MWPMKMQPKAGIHEFNECTFETSRLGKWCRNVLMAGGWSLVMQSKGYLLLIVRQTVLILTEQVNMKHRIKLNKDLATDTSHLGEIKIVRQMKKADNTLR